MDMKYHIETAWHICLDSLVSLVILTLALGAASVFSIGLLAPVCFAGYTHALNQLLIYGREPRAQDIFSQLRLLIPLLAFWILAGLFTAIGFTILVLPGIIFTIIISYTCLYMIPVMVDLEYGLFDAIKKSISMMTRTHVVDQIIVCMIFFALTTIGGSSFIGFLFLQPFATLFLLSVYKESK